MPGSQCYNGLSMQPLYDKWFRTGGCGSGGWQGAQNTDSLGMYK
jgi:hypothetical protein